MTVKAKLADGRVLEFPDGTAPSVVQQTVKRMLGQGQAQPSTAAAHGARVQMTPITPDIAQSANQSAFGGALYTNAMGEPRVGNPINVAKGIWNTLLYPGHVAPNMDPISRATGAYEPKGAGTKGVFATDESGRVNYSPEAQNAAFGLASIANPVNPGVRAGDLAVPGVKTSLQKPALTPQSVAKIGGKQMQQARDLPVDFAPGALNDWSRTTVQGLNNRGLSDVSAPLTTQTIQKFQSPPEGTVAITGNNIMAFRQELQNIAKKAGTSGDGPEFAAASSAIEALDEFVHGNLGQGAVSGPVDRFVKIYDEGRANYAAAARATDIGKKQAIAENRAAAANSGKNLGNALRQRAADLLNKDEAARLPGSEVGPYLRGWTKEERAALQAVVDGTASMNRWRTISNRLAGGGGIASTLLGGATAAGTGAAVGGWPGMLAGAAVGSLPVMAGSAARGTYNKMVGKALDRLEQQLLERSPAAKNAAATVADNPRALMNLLRATLLTQARPKVPQADELYLSAKKQRDELNAANEKMRRGIR